MPGWSARRLGLRKMPEDRADTGGSCHPRRGTGCRYRSRVPVSLVPPSRRRRPLRSLRCRHRHRYRQLPVHEQKRRTNVKKTKSDRRAMRKEETKKKKRGSRDPGWISIAWVTKSVLHGDSDVRGQGYTLVNSAIFEFTDVEFTDAWNFSTSLFKQDFSDSR